MTLLSGHYSLREETFAKNVFEGIDLGVEFPGTYIVLNLP